MPSYYVSLWATSQTTTLPVATFLDTISSLSLIPQFLMMYRPAAFVITGLVLLAQTVFRNLLIPDLSITNTHFDHRISKLTSLRNFIFAHVLRFSPSQVGRRMFQPSVLKDLISFPKTHMETTLLYKPSVVQIPGPIRINELNLVFPRLVYQSMTRLLLVVVMCYVPRISSILQAPA